MQERPLTEHEIKIIIALLEISESWPTMPRARSAMQEKKHESKTITNYWHQEESKNKRQQGEQEETRRTFSAGAAG